MEAGLSTFSTAWWKRNNKNHMNCKLYIMYRKTVLLMGLIMAVQTIVAQNNTNSYTLQQAIERGIESNLDVRQAEILMKTGKLDWNQARLNQLPSVEGSAASGINQGRSIDPFTNSFVNQQINFSSYAVSAGVVLFNGMAMHNASKQNAYAYEAAKMDWQQARDNLTIQVILAYLQVLTSEDLLAQAQNQEKLAAEQVARLMELDKLGAIPPSDLSDLRGQYANDKLAVINARNTLATAKINLCQLLNIPYNEALSLERIDAASYATRYEATPDSIYQVALERFAQVKAAELRRMSWKHALKAERGRLFPSLSLNAGATTNYSSAARSSTFLGTSDITSDDYVVVNGNNLPVMKRIGNYEMDKIRYGKQLNNNLYSQVSLNLRIPIFSNWSQRTRIRRAELNLENMEIQEQTTKTQLQQAIEQAHVNMTSALDRFHTLLEQKAAFEESFRAAEARFNEGVGTTIDYLTARNNLDRATINLIAARYDYVLRTRVLDYYQGGKL